MEQLIYEVRVLQNILAFGCFLLVILLALFGAFSISSFAQLTAWKDTVEMLNLDKPNTTKRCEMP